MPMHRLRKICRSTCTCIYTYRKSKQIKFIFLGIAALFYNPIGIPISTCSRKYRRNTPLAYMVSPSSGHHCACLWAGTYRLQSGVCRYLGLSHRKKWMRARHAWSPHSTHSLQQRSRRYPKGKKQLNHFLKDQKSKRTTLRIPTWSPTVVLTEPEGA